MKFIDFFAGIGGIRTGFEQAGMQCVGYVEWDKYARKSYETIYNTEGEYTGYDIQDVKGTELPEADIWCFGSPCQNVSVSGTRTGLGGEQSRMFFEVIRCLKERIQAKKSLPRFTLMENVKNLLSSNEGWDFAEVLLQMDSVGYDVEWSVIDSAEVIPQHRERIFVVGHLRGQRTRQVFPIQRQSEGSNRKPKINVTYHEHSQQNSVKQIGNFLLTKSFGGNSQRGGVYDQKGISPTLNSMTGGGLQPHILVKATLTPDRLNKRQNGRRFKEDGEPSFTLTAADRHGVMFDEQKDDNNGVWYHGKAIRKLTPLECWRLQGFSDEAFYKAKNAGVSNSQLYKQAGNSVTVPVIRAIAEKIAEVSKD